MSGTWVKAASVEDIAQAAGLQRVRIGGHDICLYVIDDTVWATQNRCTHGNASLCDGWMEDGTIECPLHQGTFDIRTGRAMSAPVTVDLATYPARVEGGVVWVQVGSE